MTGAPDKREHDSWYLTMVLGAGAGCFGALLLLRGCILVHLWRWFVVPLGAPELHLIHALGLATLVLFFTHHPVTRAKDRYGPMENVMYQFFEMLLFLLVVWGVAASVHSCM